MKLPFLYDTHYQVDKPLALVHLTLATASPTAHVTDDALAVRLAARAKASPVDVNGGPARWDINADAMRYWIGNCHQTALLTRQNAYDYWLMNFHFAAVFCRGEMHWGKLGDGQERFARLLLLRWAWIFDAPILVALFWKVASLGGADSGVLVDRNNRHIEEILENVLGVLREDSSDARESVKYRLLMEEMRHRQLKPNTRRHKLLTHLKLLADAGLLTEDRDNSRPTLLIRDSIGSYPTMRDAIRASLRRDPMGRGSAFFLEVVREGFGLKTSAIVPIDDETWVSILPDIQSYFHDVEQWDRKFLSIEALAELFLVKNLLANKPTWPHESWRELLLARARTHPEELTVHVNRFGKIEFLRLSSA